MAYYYNVIHNFSSFTNVAVFGHLKKFLSNSRHIWIDHIWLSTTILFDPIVEV